MKKYFDKSLVKDAYYIVFIFGLLADNLRPEAPAYAVAILTAVFCSIGMRCHYDEYREKGASVRTSVFWAVSVSSLYVFMFCMGLGCIESVLLLPVAFFFGDLAMLQLKRDVRRNL